MDIILAGGGTAGHVSPALAVSEEILSREPRSRILFIGRAGGKENDAVAKAGIELKTIKIEGIQRKLSLENAKRVYHAFRAVGASRSIIRDFKPDVILGTGGYVCWPVLKAGIALGIPTAIHESNISPGLVTKLLSTKCERVFLNYPDTREYLSRKARCLAVGNPLRHSFKKIKREDARRLLGIKENEIFILSVGGSIGAKRLNDVACELMRSYSVIDSQVRHVHATGVRYFDDVSSDTLAKGKNGCRIVPYIDDMPTHLSAADIVISRAGAMTISEIASVGVATILIPSPNVSDNHQFKNADKLEKAGAVTLIEEKNLTPESLKTAVEKLKNSKIERKNKAKIISNFFSPNASRLIFNELKRLVFDNKS